MKKHALIAALFAVLATPFSVEAQSTSALVEKYTPLAGSEENAKSLVNGLRNDTKLGNGGINIALALTEAKLKQDGISQPTPQQLQSALNDVLRSRADGKGWGEIAHSMGFKLGDVMRNEKVERPERVAHQRMDRPERPQRPERR